MTLAKTAARMLARSSESATLARNAPTAEGTTITLKARRIVGTLDPLNNAAAQQSFRVKIGTAELLASAWTTKAPARGDTLTIGGKVRKVLDARPIKDGATVALYELEVAG